VRKPTKRDIEDERLLEAAGHPIPERRLARWRTEEGLEPWSENPARRVEHHITLDMLSARGRPADKTVLLLASRGFATRRYLDLLVSPNGLGLSLFESLGTDEHSAQDRVAQVEDEAADALDAMASGPFAEIAEQMRTNITGHGELAVGEDPLGGQNVILEEIGRGIHGLEPDPAAPTRLGDTLPPEMGAPDAFMSEIAVGLLSAAPVVMIEAARIVRSGLDAVQAGAPEAPEEIEEVARTAVTLREQLLGDDPDDEEVAKTAALMAPLFVAFRNVISPALEPVLRRRGLPTEHLTEYVGLPPKPM
jgi:hypothetical protein